MKRSPEAAEPPGSSSSAGADPPWIETREGGLFFVNALLVAPELVVLLPLGAGALLRAVGLLGGPSELLDTVPRMAGYVLPWVGWLLVIPVWTTGRNLGLAKKGLVRALLAVFLMTHLSFLGYTILRWAGGVR